MVDREAVGKGAALVAASTLAVTVAFVGVLALITGAIDGIESRFPFYAVAFSIAFTVLVITLERYLDGGDQIILTASVLALVVGIVFALDVEGLLYAVENPGDLVASRIILYFAAAGCLCTGLVYWGVHHWREFVAT